MPPLWISMPCDETGSSGAGSSGKDGVLQVVVGLHVRTCRGIVRGATRPVGVIEPPAFWSGPSHPLTLGRPHETHNATPVSPRWSTERGARVVPDAPDRGGFSRSERGERDDTAWMVSSRKGKHGETGRVSDGGVLAWG